MKPASYQKTNIRRHQTNSVHRAILRKQFLHPCPTQWAKSRNQVVLTVMYIHHNSLELTTTIYSEDTNFWLFRRSTNIYDFNGWQSTQGTCKVILVVFWWRKKICRNRIRVVLLVWDVRPRYYLIGSRRFETRKRSHLQGSKCSRQRIFWPLQIRPLRRHCATSHNKGDLTYTAATA